MIHKKLQKSKVKKEVMKIVNVHSSSMMKSKACFEMSLNKKNQQIRKFRGNLIWRIEKNC